MKLNFNALKNIALLSCLCLSLSCSAKDNFDSNIHYTKLNSCKESIENENAAASLLKCDSIGGYELSITIQDPVFFTMTLSRGNKSKMTEFEELSRELPLETGRAVEWHVVNGEPQFMIFRVSWGTEEAPFDMTERLVLNYVADDRICPVATVNTKKHKNANEKIRQALAQDFMSIKVCPDLVLEI